MGYEQIAYEVEDGLLTITLDRPEHLNAFTATMLRELLDAFDRADADDEVRAVVVTGPGRAFCAGADLSAGPATFDVPPPTARAAQRNSASCSAISERRLPRFVRACEV